MILIEGSAGAPSETSRAVIQMSAVTERKRIDDQESSGGVEERPLKADRLAEKIKESLGEAWMPRIYREKILPTRTRSYHLQLSPKAVVSVQHTLLGVELKI